MKKKNNNLNVYKNKSVVSTTNPKVEVSKKRADLKQKAELQKAVVTDDLTKIKKDARKVLFVAGAALVTFGIVRALTKEKPKPQPNPPPKEPTPVCPPTEEKEDSWGKMIFKWVAKEAVSYAAEKVKSIVYNYVHSRINKEQNVEEDTANTYSKKETRD